MSILFEKEPSEYTYQELPSGIVVATQQIMIPKSKILVPNETMLSSANTLITCVKNNSFINTPMIVTSDSAFNLGKYTMVKGR